MAACGAKEEGPSDRRFPLLVGAAAFGALALVPAVLLAIAALSLTLYTSAPDLPFGERLRLFGYLGLLIGLVLCVSPVAVLLGAGALFRALRRAVQLRACDLWLSKQGVRVEGGPADGFCASWEELSAPGGTQWGPEGLRLLGPGGGGLVVPTPGNADERASLEALAATIAAHAAATLAPGPADSSSAAAAMLRCKGCGASLRPLDAPSIICQHCGATQPMPEEVAVRIAAGRAVGAARAADERLIASLQAQPGAKLANAAAFAGGLCAVVMCLFALMLSAVFTFSDGREAGLPRWGGAGLLLLGLGLLVFAIVRRVLADRGALRLLTLGFSAMAPEREGDPQGCRLCRAPLPAQDPDHQVCRCVFCGADNVLFADLRVQAAVLERFGGGALGVAQALTPVRWRRRRASALGLAGLVLLAAGGSWQAWPGSPEVWSQTAVVVPHLGVKNAPSHGEVKPGPGAARLERVAVLHDDQYGLLAEEDGEVLVVLVGKGRIAARTSEQGAAATHTPPPLPPGDLWARDPAGGPLWVLGRGAVTRWQLPEVAPGHLYGGGVFHDRVVSHLAAGPGGSALVTTRATGHGHWRLRRLDGRGKQEVLFHDAREAALHPDGNQLALSFLVGESFQLGLSAIARGAPIRQLTSGEAHARFPTWSPDGTRLAFITGSVRDSIQHNTRYGEEHLWVLGLDGELTRLTHGVNLLPVAPVWTARGIHILSREVVLETGKIQSVLWRVVPEQRRQP